MIPTKNYNLHDMAKILIKDTTVSERAQIVREALGADTDCEGIDLADMYDDYIYGIRELADINREFSEMHAGEIVIIAEEEERE